MKVRRWVVAFVVAGVGGPAAAVALVQANTPELPDRPPAVTIPVNTPIVPPDTSARARVVVAKRVLPTVQVKGRAPRTGYDRDRFGDGWADWGRCDTRQRILARDLVGERKGTNGCTVLTGTLRVEPYTGHRVSYVRAGGYAHALDIDHVYPLSLAWQQGAWRWTDAKRERFANDPANLLATDPSANREKGDSGPAAWLPRKAERCDYVARLVLVAGRYRLSMNQPDHDTAERILGSC